MRVLVLAVALAASLVALGVASGARAESFVLSHDAPSEVRFTVEAPLDAIVGSSHRLSGEVMFDADTVALSGGTVKADAATFRTGIALRDEDLRDQFFEVQRFPDIILTLQKLSRLSSTALAPGARLEADVSGTLSLHGATRAVTFPVSIERSGDGGALTVRGNFDVAYLDYGIQRPRKLFLKLGELAKVDVRATFVRVPTAGAPPPPLPTFAAEAPPPPVGRANARKSLPKDLLAKLKKHEAPRFQYPAETAAGRGERLMRDPTIGGQGNALTCYSCHGDEDERLGFVDEGAVKPNHTLFDVARRPTLWQGFAKTVGQASSFCAKMFQLKPEGLTASQQSDIETFLARLSPDQESPAIDYRVLWQTKKAELAHPTDGNAKNGEKLLGLHCEACHGIGAPRPPLTPGLYEADYLVQRVRHLDGNDARQMPALTVDRLTDSELRDIVTYLAGNPNERVFQRKRAPKTAQR